MAQDYKFNGKEAQNELELNWLDFETRMYQPDLGRMASIDAHAYNYFSHSPYAYVLNNPLLYSDPTGMDTIPATKGFIPTPVPPPPETQSHTSKTDLKA